MESGRTEQELYMNEHRAHIEAAFAEALAAVVDVMPDNPMPFIARYLTANHPEPPEMHKKWSSSIFFSEESMAERLTADATAALTEKR
jgi:hypothetical protein